MKLHASLLHNLPTTPAEMVRNTVSYSLRASVRAPSPATSLAGRGCSLAESSGSATGTARPPGWWRRRHPMRLRRVRSGARTRAVSPPATSPSQPLHELDNGHIGQPLSGSRPVSSPVKSSSQRPLHIRTEIYTTPSAFRFTATSAPLRTGPCPCTHLKRDPATTNTSSPFAGTKHSHRGNSPGRRRGTAIQLPAAAG